VIEWGATDGDKIFARSGDRPDDIGVIDVRVVRTVEGSFGGG
jgi:hypothetical protein